MRDFNNAGEIYVDGDFNVTDNSQAEYKSYVHCSNETLFEERPFRAGNIKLEQKRKVKRLKPFYGLSILLLFAAAIWAMIQGNTNLITILMGAASAFIGYMSLNLTFEPNAFQREEQGAVNEITNILKKRRAE